jgi:hypothetical protein
MRHLLKILGLIAFLPIMAMAQNRARLSTGIQELLDASSPETTRRLTENTGWKGQYFFVARFSALPNASQKNVWEKTDFRFHSRLDANTYLVSTHQLPDAAWMQQHQIAFAAEQKSRLKLSKKLALGDFPSTAFVGTGKIKLLVSVHPGINLNEVKAWLREQHFQIEPTAFEISTRILTIHTATDQINTLAAAAFTEYIQPVNPPDQPLNQVSRSFSRAYSLNAPLAMGGRNLLGQGVVVGVGDNADPTLHPDLTDRIINRTPGIVEDHGAHVTGTVAGGGVILPDQAGFAPKATVVSQYFSGIWQNAGTYVQDYNMVLTNNSYAATGSDCDYNGAYDLYSRILDQQASDYPQLLHVFASGNSGDDMCSPYPVRFNTILGNYQVAKNVITSGRTDYPQTASLSSSSGPVMDGRLKPEITALGIVSSTFGKFNIGNPYYTEYGTSQSAPAITGGLTLLYQRYRQLFGGADPRGALIKSLLLNGARDLGNPGPDYRHGYGIMHLENSLRMMENHQYFGGTVNNGGMKDSVIAVPANTAQLKVLLYWHDPAATPLATKTLVNDLDLEVIGPGGTILPLVLNPSPATVNNNAVPGQDHINNSEQVLINNPTPGNYTIRVKGTEVFVNPSQEYFVSFDAVPTGIKISVPFTGDTWAPTNPYGYYLPISWDDEGTGTGGTYTIEYSINNGGNWTTIINNLADNQRSYTWQPPAGTATNDALIRITKNSSSFTATSGKFSILGRPVHSLAAPAEQCEGYIKINWAAVTGADDYEVVIKKGAEMVPVATTTALTYTIPGLNKDSIYYVAARARKAGIPGKWNIALQRQPNSGSCSGTISDGDLKLDSITSPRSGRQFTSTALTNNETIAVRIKNLDNVAIAAGSFDVKYSLDGSAYISQPSAGGITALGTYLHSFTGIDLSATGMHVIKAVVKNNALPDNVPQNDTFTLVVKNLPNAAIALPYIENFDAAPVATYNLATTGLDNLDRWDYANFDPYARARTFVNSGIAYSGNRAITLDVSKAPPYLKTPGNNLFGTMNLAGYTVNDEVRLDFQFKHHGSAQGANAQNKVWIRDKDTDPWVEIYDLYANQPMEAGVWKKSKSLELNDLLKAANALYNFSTSTQIRFGQWSPYGMADNKHYAGYSFDDVRMYVAVNDMQLLSIDEPAIYSCGLNNAVLIKVTVRNSISTAASGVQVSYRINGGSLVTETIPGSIAANSQLVYQFITPANLSAVGNYSIEASVNFPGDNVPDNNSQTIEIVNQPVVESFPYLENFENGNGNYYTTGINSSWEYGSPASLQIDTAASGINAWKTRLRGNYNDNEYSYLVTPCFNISTLANPMLSFAIAYDIENCIPYGGVCDATWVEYSLDGVNWLKLGQANQGTKWYDNAQYNIWVQRKQTYWHSASIPLPKGASALRLRFVMYSDDGTAYEGIAIDDIHIYDLPAPMFGGNNNSNAVTQNVSGNAPVHFTDNGKLIASILPNNYNLGSTEAKAYIHNGPVRNTNQQYYANRNITIKPSNTIPGFVTVRFYFTNREVDSMRLATNCPSCTPLEDYTHLGVTQYTDPDKAIEDGTLANNVNGIYNFFGGEMRKLIPFDSGYYAEFNVTNFSEFWLNDGRNGNIPLPGKWINFSATKANAQTGKLQWEVSNESDIAYYEIQVADSKENANANNFITIGKLNAKNTSLSNYVYLDERPKKGPYYYRIRQVDKNGNSSYTPVRLLSFGERMLEISLYPNPAKDRVTLQLQSNEAEQLQVKIMDITGKLLYLQPWNTSGSNNQFYISLRNLRLSNGVYTVAVGNGSSWWYGKLVKAD